MASTYLIEVFKIFGCHDTALVANLLHSHDEQLKGGFVSGSTDFVVKPRIFKIGEHLIDDRFVNIMKTK